jgi:hypothetical protein
MPPAMFPMAKSIDNVDKIKSQLKLANELFGSADYYNGVPAAYTCVHTALQVQNQGGQT